MLKVLYIDVYAFLNPDETFSFVTYFVSMKFEILSDVLEEPFSVSNLVGDSVVAGFVRFLCLIKSLWFKWNKYTCLILM